MVQLLISGFDFQYVLQVRHINELLIHDVYSGAIKIKNRAQVGVKGVLKKRARG